MCMDKDYQMIDHSIKINKEELPKLLQNIIKDLEKYKLIITDCCHSISVGF